MSCTYNLQDVPLGHLIKSGDTLLIRGVHEYFMRLNGPLAGLMLMICQIENWEYIGRLE